MALMKISIEFPRMPEKLVITPVLSDEEFEELCETNSVVALERTKEGEIIVNPLVGFATACANSEITYQLTSWCKKHGRGEAFGSKLGIFLPDGSSMNPDAGYITQEQRNSLTNQDFVQFLHFAPDFIIELLPNRSSLRKSQVKMENWMRNGVQLGWLVDPHSRSVHIYEAGKEPRIESGTEVIGSGPIEGFMLNLREVWSEYEI
jgi:Uma2 family endonuclease